MNNNNRNKDMEQACRRLQDIAETDLEAREIASHLIISVLNSVKDAYEDIVERKVIPSDETKATSKAVSKALGILIDLYEGTDENFDVYDYETEDDKPVELEEHILNKLLEI